MCVCLLSTQAQQINNKNQTDTAIVQNSAIKYCGCQDKNESHGIEIDFDIQWQL